MIVITVVELLISRHILYNGFTDNLYEVIQYKFTRIVIHWIKTQIKLNMCLIYSKTD